MKKFVILLGLVLIGLAVWMVLRPSDWQTWLGFSKADYFKYGQNYAFASGPGPMILTALGMSTIITGLWHAHNCHVEGCWRVGRHKIKGTPYCNLHEDIGRNQEDTDDLLREISAKMDVLLMLIGEQLKPPPDEVRRAGPPLL